MKLKIHGLIAGLIVLIAVMTIPALAQTRSEEKKAGSSDRPRVVKEMEVLWQRAKKHSLHYVDAMPEGAYGFKPMPEIRSFAEQMLHLAYWNYGVVEPAIGKPNPFGKDEPEKKAELKTKAAVRKIIEQSYDYIIAGLANLDEKKLGEEVNFFGEKLTRATLMTIAIDHQSHHRGQMAIYLRLKGVTPPPE
jgi:uncharacterized damage-inducible protein DinB